MIPIHTTARDLRDTSVWADESHSLFPSQINLNAGNVNMARHVEIKLSTPRGYATQTRTSIQIIHAPPLGGPANMEGTHVLFL